MDTIPFTEAFLKAYDDFFYTYLDKHKNFSSDDAYERAQSDARGGIDFLTLTFGRSLPDPDDQSRILLVFSYGQESLRHEREAPDRLQQTMDAFYAAHPELKDIPVTLSLMGA